MALRWYVVHAYSNFEHRVAEGLKDRIKMQGLEHKFGEILVPTEEVVEMRDGQKRKSDRADYQRHHGKRRESQVWARLEQRYGITREEYEALLDKQGGVCAICGNGCKTGQRLAVDHCHETGRVRGLLCKSCNLHIGILERHEWVAKAQEYLDGSVLRVQQGWQDASGGALSRGADHYCLDSDGERPV